MNPEAFQQFIENVRKSGLPGAEIIIAFAAVASGFTLVRSEGGELQAVRA
ncbi:hypothetical protein [Mycobacterium sp. TY813]|nr:hypothetical protein [Mycobacterium sp. TY813]MDP7729544.1 hypothetical protein [Mycobacterium sp. TY813]